jgi:hypothetical protein
MIARLLRSALNGFAAGLVATFLMSRGFSIAQSLGAIRELPPRKAVKAVSPQIEEPNRTTVATVAHYLVGGGSGALYGMASSANPRSRGPLTGVLFGLAVWMFGYEFLMPRVTEMPLAHRDKRSRALTILIAHVIYGLSLGTVSRFMTRKAEI